MLKTANGTMSDSELFHCTVYGVIFILLPTLICTVTLVSSAFKDFLDPFLLGQWWRTTSASWRHVVVSTSLPDDVCPQLLARAVWVGGPLHTCQPAACTPATCWRHCGVFVSLSAPRVLATGKSKAATQTADRIPTTYRPDTDYMPTTYRPHTDQIPTTYRPYNDHIPTRYRLHTDRITTTYRPDTDYIPTTYRPDTDRITTTYQPHTDQIPTTCRPYNDHIPTRYRLHTDRITTTYRPDTDYILTV